MDHGRAAVLIVVVSLPALDLPYGPFIHYGRTRITDQHRDYCELAGSRRRYALWMAINGRLVLRRGDETRTLPRHGCALLPPLSGWTVHPGQHDVCACLVFDTVYQRRQVGYSGSRAAVDNTVQPSPAELWAVELPVPLPEQDWPAARRALALANRTWWLSPLDHMRANLVVSEWLLELVASLRSEGPPPSDPLDRAEIWARRHLAAGADVAGMAEVARMSRPRFSAVYHLSRGRPAGDYLDEVRINEAVRLIRAGGLSLAAVARAVGWSKRETLVRRCRMVLGDHPRAWKPSARSG